MSEVYARSRSNRSRSRRGARSGLHLPSALSIAAAVGVIALVIVMFPLDWLREPRINLTVNQSIFSPNRDGTLDTVSAFYTLSEQATVTVQVLNQAGQVVRLLQREQPQQPGQHATIWDGRDEGGNVVNDGNYRILVVAAGTARRSEQSIPITVDTTPPALSLANLPERQTLRTPTLQIEGSTEPDAVVWINDEPTPVAVDANGVFRVTRQMIEGENGVRVRALDAAGNESRAEALVVLRTQPPALAISVPEANAWVSNNVVRVAGAAPPDVTVTVNDRPAPVDAEGNFGLDVVLQEGDNVIRIVATDSVGNRSLEERVVHLRSRGPIITLANVPDGLKVRDASLGVTGQVDPGSRLVVNGNTVPVDNQGNFSSVVALQGGNNLLTFSATDRAGNTTTLQRNVVFETAAAPVVPGVLGSLLGDGLALRFLAGTALLLATWLLLGGWLRPIHFVLSVDSPTFYPNRPDDSRTLTMRLDLSRAAKVTLDVYDQMDRHVASLVENRRHTGGEHFRLWDGRDSFGHVLPTGTYLIEATARTLTSSVSSAVWVRLDATPIMLGTQGRTSNNSANSNDRRHYVHDDGEVIDVL